MQLIKTLRKDFDSPNAKFVLATGCGNPGREGFGLQIAEAQLAVDGDKGKYPEFKGNIRAVDSRDLWREADVSPINQGHHYNHNAETYYKEDELARHSAACGYRFKVERFEAREFPARVTIANIGVAPLYYAAYPAVNGVRAAKSLAGLLPGQRRDFTIASCGTAPALTIESDRLIPGQRIGFESQLNP